MMRIELISVVVPVTQDNGDVVSAYHSYRRVLGRYGKPVEFIYVLDGPMPQAAQALRALKNGGEPVEILSFATPFGESAALTVGFRHAAGDVVFTLTPRIEVAPDALPALLDALATADLVVGRRVATNRGQPQKPRKFERTINVLFGTSLQDIRSRVRVMRAEVAKELTVYGNQYQFLPLLALAQGFAVTEVDLPSTRMPPRLQRFLPVDVSLLLDVVTVYFLLRFLKKPFRFFGGFGFAVLALGAVFTTYLVLARLVFGIPLVDRPALVLSTLMVVLGIQIISVGLIGEIVAFTYAKDIRDYRVDRIVEPTTVELAEEKGDTAVQSTLTKA
ncbi:glycosyltransferase [Benzoatithermus flavus]|uniref:Glycosyltransferase n=1 Tax=Benzoatithermus flavus TaxID=3108223 RepID=A0ABU8XVG0_9PROT